MFGAMKHVWILQEFCGSLEDMHCTNFVGAYRTKEAAIAARKAHAKNLESAGRSMCIDGYCLTRLDVQSRGEINFCYMTEEV